MQHRENLAAESRFHTLNPCSYFAVSYEHEGYTNYFHNDDVGGNASHFALSRG
jgi:hypothetical protein